MRRAALVLALVLALAVTVAACGEDGADSGGQSQTAAPAETAAATPAETAAGHARESGGTVDAAALYGQYCAGCHGDTGAGGPGGPAVAGEDDTAEMAGVIEQGTSGMPGFAGDMSAAQIEALAEYVATQLK